MKHIQSLCYEGKVDIFYEKKNGKSLHIVTLNEGKQAISELFTRACLGYNIDLYMPSAVDLVDENGTSVLIHKNDIRAKSFGTIANGDYEGWLYPVLDSLILTENILDIQSGIHSVILYNKKDEQLARASFYIKKDGQGDSGDLPTLNLASKNDILIRWSLYLSNKEEA